MAPIASAQVGDCELLIVGSETLLRHDITDVDLLAFIQQVRAAAPGIPVTTADVCSELWNRPTFLQQLDVILVNYYPFWEGYAIEDAMGLLHSWHQQLVAAAPSKTVMVSETGWPSCGNTVGAAVPSPANAAAFFKNLAVFDGETQPDNWSGTAPVGGPGTPAISFTHVPALGNTTENLEGAVLHVAPAGYRVAVYIRVNGTWWAKPTFANPTVIITTSGHFVCDITTGGIDETATEVAAFLIPTPYTPPVGSFSASLPSELDVNSAAKAIVTR